jgi:hypothetical protein
MLKAVLLLALVAISLGRNYPLFKQCNPDWANEQLGYSSDTICSAGCLMSSASMALAGTGHWVNPSILNQWLKTHGGYVSGDLFVWGSLSPFGLIYQGKVANYQIKSQLDQGRIVIVNVMNGAHWVLAYGYNGDNILVNDPGFNVGSYYLSQIVDGQTGVYVFTGANSASKNLLQRLKGFVKPSEGKKNWWNDADGGKI